MNVDLRKMLFEVIVSVSIRAALQRGQVFEPPGLTRSQFGHFLLILMRLKLSAFGFFTADAQLQRNAERLLCIKNPSPLETAKI